MTKTRLYTTILNLLIFALTYSNSMAQEGLSEGPGTYKILTNEKGPIRIPFKMHKGKPLLKVEINGKVGALMIDNGILWDEVWLFGSPIINQLDLKPENEGSIGGAGEGDPSSAFFATTNLTIKFDDIIFYEQPVIVSPPAAGFASMFPGTDGQVCNMLFKHFIVEFDFIDNYVILHKPEEFKAYKNGCAVSMSLNKSGTYAVPYSFTTLDGKKYKGKTDIDFGGIYEFKVALNNGMNIQVPDNAEEVLGRGAQGKITGYKGEIKNMTLGSYRFDRPSVAFGDEGTSRIHPENLGVIGLPMFMKFKIAFDYFNNKIYLEPNSNFDGVLI